MAFTEFYCQSGGSNLNAGSTNDNAAAFTYASGNWVQSTGVFTVASGNPASDGVAVGDFASVYADGSTTTGFFGRVTARDATTITVSLTAKSGTAPADGTGNRTLKIGGAWLGPNGAEDFPFDIMAAACVNAAGNTYRVNLKNDATYSITASITMTLAGPGVYQGYSSSVGDGGRATIDGGTSGASYLLMFGSSSVADMTFEDLILQNNGATGSFSGWTHSGPRSTARRCVVHDVKGPGFRWDTNGGTFIECEAYNTTTGFLSNGGRYLRCIAHDNSGASSDGFSNNTGYTQYIDCIADSNGRHGFNHPTGVSWVTIWENCDAYNNGSNGFTFSQAGVYYFENCNAIKNGGYGIQGTGAGVKTGYVLNMGFGAGTQANTSGTSNGLSDIVESGSVTYANDVTPWVDPANGDFRINLATAKNAGRGAFTQTASSYTGTVGYPDIGAAQHLDAGGGGGTVVVGTIVV